MLTKAEFIAVNHYVKYFEKGLSFIRILEEITNRLYKDYPPKVILKPEFLNLDTNLIIDKIDHLADHISEIPGWNIKEELSEELPF